MRRPPYVDAAPSGQLDSRGREGGASPVVDNDTRARRQPGRSRRRRLIRVVFGLNMVLSVALVAAGGLYGYTRYRFAQINRIGLPSSAKGASGADVVLTDAPAGVPFNVLLVGSDTRNLDAADQKLYGTPSQVGGARSDTLIVVHVDPKAGSATLVSIPRDLYVPIADSGHSDRINSAFDGTGGPARLIKTIRAALGIEVNHFAQVDFVGFRSIVGDVGGVGVYFTAPARDGNTGLRITGPGCTTLDGTAALAYVRSRHYEMFENGRWHSDPTSDFGRIGRQQDFIRRVLHKALAQATSNPLTLNSLVASGVKSLTVDSGFAPDEMVQLGRRFRSLNPDQLPMQTLPAVAVTINGADVLRLQRPQADATLAAVGGQLPAVGPSAGSGATVTTEAPLPVAVVNGTISAGLGQQAVDGLQAAGVAVPAPSSSGAGAVATTIAYPAGQRAAAERLASVLAGPARLQQSARLRGRLVLTLGPDFAGVRPNVQLSPVLPPATAAPAAAPAANPTPAPAGVDPARPC